MSNALAPGARPGRLTLLVPLAVLMTLALILLSACGVDSESDGEDTGAATGETADDSGDGSVTVSGAFGDTVIEGTPERVLPLSPQDADFVMDLGITPVALPVYPDTLEATDGTGVWPWQEEALGGEVPEQLDLSEDVGQMGERIAALEPDVIVATGFWGLTEEVHQRLEAVAPVVHFDTMANGEPWQESQAKVGQALGHDDEAAEAVSQAEERIEQVKEENPEFAGLTYNAVIGDQNNQLYVLAAPDRGIGMLITAMGLELDPEIQDLPTDEDGRGLLSYEEIGTLDADVVFVVSPDGDTGYLTDTEAWAQTEAGREDRVVSLPRTSGIPSAAGFPSPLSVQWVLDQFADQLNEVTA